MKIELGGPHELLDRLERTAGPHARRMLERFLEQVQQAEAKFKGETGTGIRDLGAKRTRPRAGPREAGPKRLKASTARAGGSRAYPNL